MKTYFKGGKGIEDPVDVNGVLIKEGDILTHSWFDGEDYVDFFKRFINITDLEEIEKLIHEPKVIVKYNKEGEFYFGEGLKEIGVIKSRAYAHDFTFKYCKIVENHG